MQEKELISVIVPIFRVEAYLRKCVDSLLAQSYKNVEIILVDDGSDDSSPAICDEYQELYDRVRVIHKKNGGLSDARNCGLEIARGDYVCFIDSDDWIHAEMLEILMNNMLETNSDISVCEFKDVYEEIEDLPVNSKSYEVWNKETALSDLYNDKYVAMTVAWNKIYKKSLFNKICYPVGKWHEDEFTTYKLLASAQKVVYTDEPLYYYRQREKSITSEFSIKRLDILEAYDERIIYSKEVSEQFYNDTLCMYMDILISYYYKFIHMNDEITAKKINDKYNSLYPVAKKNNSISIKTKFRYWLFSSNKKIYKSILRV